MKYSGTTPEKIAQKLGLSFVSRCSFSDLSGSPYQDEIQTMATYNLISGYSDGTFKPTNPVNRQELAKILYGYDVFAKRVGQDFAVELTYTDLNSIPDWALEAVNYCSAAGYLQGSNGVFNPKGKTTRCQAAKVLSVMAA